MAVALPLQTRIPPSRTPRSRRGSAADMGSRLGPMTVYLDHAATSPMRPEVLSAYTEALGVVGNPSSIHGAGQAARTMLEEGREAVAASLGADAVEVVLTGGGTEAVNLG